MATRNTLAGKRAGENKVDKAKNLRSLVDRMAPGIAKALPAMIGRDRFIRAAMSAISNTPALADCTQDSFLGALMSSAQLGLEPNTPLAQAYLIPYAGKVQFQIGYKGMIELARRAGITIQTHEIKERDQFEYEYGLEPKLKHVPAFGDRGQTIGYYCVWRGKDGQFGMEVSTKEEITKFAKEKSQAFSKGPWKTDFDAMAKKTVIKQALKYAPISVELDGAVAADEGVKNVTPDQVLTDSFDVTLVPSENVDDETGEVIDAEVVKKQQQEPAAEPAPERPEPVDPGESLI